MKRFGMAALALLFVGCGNGAVLSPAGASTDGDEPAEDLEHTGSCAKIEGANIGVENLTLEVGGKTLTFHSWVLKNGEAGEFIGFSFAASGPLSLRVKAGGETYDAEGGTWVHPDAATDPTASAVSNVEGCDPEDPTDDPNGDDPGNNPDDGDNGDLPDNN